jgi:redox-sensitive bicupin YhaK (pirin superfamily)
MGFRSLRVINEDRVAPGAGFGTHGHRDMEILTYVLEGSLAHKESMGYQQALGSNEIQRMSAGTRGKNRQQTKYSHSELR